MHSTPKYLVWGEKRFREAGEMPHTHPYKKAMEGKTIFYLEDKERKEKWAKNKTKWLTIL